MRKMNRRAPLSQINWPKVAAGMDKTVKIVARFNRRMALTQVTLKYRRDSGRVVAYSDLILFFACPADSRSAL